MLTFAVFQPRMLQACSIDRPQERRLRVLMEGILSKTPLGAAARNAVARDASQDQNEVPVVESPSESLIASSPAVGRRDTRIYKYMCKGLREMQILYAIRYLTSKTFSLSRMEKQPGSPERVLTMLETKTTWFCCPLGATRKLFRRGRRSPLRTGSSRVSEAYVAAAATLPLQGYVAV